MNRSPTKVSEIIRDGQGGVRLAHWRLVVAGPDVPSDWIWIVDAFYWWASFDLVTKLRSREDKRKLCRGISFFGAMMALQDEEGYDCIDLCLANAFARKPEYALSTQVGRALFIAALKGFPPENIGAKRFLDIVAASSSPFEETDAQTYYDAMVAWLPKPQ